MRDWTRSSKPLPSLSHFNVPEWFGTDDTEYSGWLNFTTAFGENNPDVEGSTGDAVLNQTVPGAIVTGSMNIYNPAGASVFEISDSVERPLKMVVFQSWTTGTELDYDSLVLEYNDGETKTLTATREEIGREAGGQGDTVISLWSFDLTGLGIQEFTIRVSAVAAHSSLAAARLDTRMEPAPEPLAFDVPAWAGGADAEYSGWLNFSTAVGDNNPDVAESNGDAVLNQSAPGAIITGTLNIYNPAGVSSFEVTDGVDGKLQTVVFQAWVSGTELDYDNFVLEYNDGEVKTLSTSREELGRETGGFGDTVVSKWEWDVSALTISEFTIRFASTGAHTSFVSARLDTRIAAVTGDLINLDLTAFADRWNYPFNASPGTRSVASVFRAVEEDGVHRHGNFVVGFDTSASVPTELPIESYIIESAQISLMTSGNFEVSYDETYDAFVTHFPEEDAAYLADADAGRPIELFGTGFRNGFTPLSWEETSPYSGGESDETNAFPATIDDNGDYVSTELAVDFTAPAESTPFAVGTLSGTTPGELIPEDTIMTFDLDLTNPKVIAYLQRSLATGRLFLTATSLNGGGQGVRTFPEFYTRDSLLGDAPALQLSVRVAPVETSPTIMTLDASGDSVRLTFSASESATYRVRHTSDFITWQTIENPELTFSESGMAEWTDTDSPGEARFYQIVRVD